MRVLGIDPALRTTGFGLIDWDGKKFILVSAGTISTSDRQPMPARLLRINTAVGRLAGQFKPDVCVLEKVFAHYRHPATAFILGQARGAICLACASARIPVAEYAATRVKKALTGKGLASKAQVQRTVASLLGLKVLPRRFDVTDALALAVSFCYLAKGEQLKRHSFGE
ncbi:MAG: crossover junction endodeoxyribonuclease RuvC [Deltaproteobacteria bacterium]